MARDAMARCTAKTVASRCWVSDTDRLSEPADDLALFIPASRQLPGLEPFRGEGDRLRRGFGIEIDPIYCDVIIQRLRDHAGLEAT